MRYRIVFSYDGAPFSGYQIQPNAPSVQQTVEGAVSTLLRSPVSITGAGRTDTAVNAVGYVAHFDCGAEALDTGELARRLNAILPRSIVVHGVEPAGEGFHARFDAVKRTYKYFLNRRKDPFVERFSYRCGYLLDVEEMNRACALLPGRRDFSCFEKTGGSNATSICTLYEAGWETYEPDHVRILGYPAAEGDYLVFTISADRFLRNMVRAVVGTCLEIGRGRHGWQWMGTVLEGGDRSMAGESVPGHALFLCGVDY